MQADRCGLRDESRETFAHGSDLQAFGFAAGYPGKVISPGWNSQGSRTALSADFTGARTTGAAHDSHAHGVPAMASVGERCSPAGWGI
jgi:hypothetical protein